MIPGNHREPVDIILGRIIAVFLIDTVIGGDGQHRTGIRVLLHIGGNVGIRLAEPHDPGNIVHAVVYGIREQLQACLRGMNQAVLQIVLKNVVTDKTDDDAHAQQTGSGNKQYPFLDTACREPDILFKTACRLRDVDRTFLQPAGAGQKNALFPAAVL